MPRRSSHVCNLLLYFAAGLAFLGVLRGRRSHPQVAYREPTSSVSTCCNLRDPRVAHPPELPITPARRKRPWGLWLALILALVSPLVIVFVRLPGAAPQDLPVLNAYHRCGVPLPLKISMDNRVQPRISVDLSPCKEKPWDEVQFLLPAGARDILFSQAGFEAAIPSLVERHAARLVTYGEDKPMQLFLYRDSLATAFQAGKHSLQIDPPLEFLDGASITFRLQGAVIRRSFTTTSLILFYLPAAGDSAASRQPNIVNLDTPYALELISSVPEPARSLVFRSGIHYDVPTSADDSGLVFNFRDSSRSVVEELLFFLLSGAFGFACGVLLEEVIKRMNRDTTSGRAPA